MPTIVKPFGQC